jgi:hypothetical protein
MLDRHGIGEKRKVISRLHLLISLASLSIPLLASCGPVYSYQNIKVAVSPQPVAVPVNSTVTFTASISNAPDGPTWVVVDGDNTNAGGLTKVGTGTQSVEYTAPPTPPIYTNTGTANVPQGTVELVADLIYCINGNCNSAEGYTVFVVTAPSVTVGVSPSTAALLPGESLQFEGYAVGNVNGAVTWQVNGVNGGSAAVGTVSAAGLYTAPLAIPITGNNITVTVISEVDPTKTASAMVTLN